MRAKGFTLIEVVLAVSILALAMSLVFGSFFAHSRVEGAARGENEAGQAARIFLEQLILDLSQTLAAGNKSLEEPTLSGGPIQVERFSGHELVLISRTGGDRAEDKRRSEPLARIIYQTRPGLTPEGNPRGDLAIIRRVEPLLGQGVEEEVICTGVIGLRISYQGKGGQVSESWSEVKNLPLMLNLELDLAPDRGAPRTYALTCGPLTALSWSRVK